MKKIISLMGMAVSLVSGAAFADGTSSPQKYDIAIEAMKFSPAHLEASVGDTVIWTNKDLVPHTATETPSGREKKSVFDSQQLNSGQKFSFRLKKPGVFHYKCLFHPGMEAEIVVVDRRQR